MLCHRENESDKQMIVYAKKKTHTQNRRESKTNTNPHKQTNKTSQNTSGIDENNNNSDNNTERTVIQSKQGLLRVQARSRSLQTSVLTATDSVAKGNQGTWRTN